MTRIFPTSLILALSLGVSAGCATDDPAPFETEVPCGIVACDIDENSDTVPDWEGNPEADVGKFDRDGVESAIALSTADGVFDADDVRDAFDAAGDRVGRGEMRAIRAALDDMSYEVTDGARIAALDMARVANLFGPERAAIESGLSAGGAPIPAAVLELLGRARLNGALAYDVQETDEDGEGVWNPLSCDHTAGGEYGIFAYGSDAGAFGRRHRRHRPRVRRDRGHRNGRIL